MGREFIPVPDDLPQAPSDWLWGGRAIGAEINQNEKVTLRLCEDGLIPARKVGSLWVASRARLREFVREAPSPPRGANGDADHGDDDARARTGVAPVRPLPRHRRGVTA
jgi:hypothetical protein